MRIILNPMSWLAIILIIATALILSVLPFEYTWAALVDLLSLHWDHVDALLQR